MDQTANIEDGLMSAVEAGRQFGYTNDYVARLAREKKVLGTRVGRQWFVDAKSLAVFVENTEEIKRQNAERVRKERLRERVEIGSRKVVMQVLPVPQSRALVLAKAGLVLCASVVVGAFFYANIAFPSSQVSSATVVEVLRSIAAELYSMGDRTETAAVQSTAVQQEASATDKKNQSGMVVVPPSDTRSLTEIADSFSDEVSVQKDPEGTSGIVTPHFKNKSESQYRFLMVPIEEEVSTST